MLQRHPRALVHFASSTWSTRVLQHCYSATAVLSRQKLSRSSAVAHCVTFAAEREATSQADSNSYPHTPVLLQEVLSFFRGRSLKLFVDGTLGAGGHSAAVLSAHPELQVLVGIDVDPKAHSIAAARLEQLKAQNQSQCKICLVEGNFFIVSSILEGYTDAHGGADGMLLDLGVSSMQLDMAERGFSFSRDGPLDMRMGPSASTSAEQIVNTWSEADLGRIIREYGEERYWRKIAARIVDARLEAPITTTKQLTTAIGNVGGSRGVGGGRKASWKKINPATRVFQALRIAVNDELRIVEEAIPRCIDSLAPGGRLGVISFHSLEDRLVKQAFLRASGKIVEGDAKGFDAYGYQQTAGPPPLGKVLTKKVVTATEKEQDENARSRSAKLRFFERT